jgi:gluconate 2-dehydrogenase gamma chain
MITRRVFFASVAAGTTALGFTEGRQQSHTHTASPETTAPAGAYQFFTAEQVVLLEAIVDRIIPSDDMFPGGKDAGVVRFIDNALANWLPQNRWDYTLGLEGIAESGRALFGKEFGELPAAQQTAVLERIEKRDVPGSPWAGQDGPDFIALLVTHSMQGYYGDPVYGGNREQVGWKMIRWME